MVMYTDPVFAPVDDDHVLERIAGGNETEVYRSDDGRYVVKVKGDLGGSVEQALQQARELQAAANHFAAYLGPSHSVPSYYVVARDLEQRAQVLVIQPYVAGAQPLHSVDYSALTDEERAEVARQLREIVMSSLKMYGKTGSMPDLYGRLSHSSEERDRQKHISMLPQRLWSFLVERNLLRSHNLMLVREPELRIILVDYDPVRRSALYRRIYYLVRWFLFWRDHTLIMLMKRGANIGDSR